MKKIHYLDTIISPNITEKSTSLSEFNKIVFKVHKDAQAMYFEPAIPAISEVGGDLVHVLEQKRE